MSWFYCIPPSLSTSFIKASIHNIHRQIFYIPSSLPLFFSYVITTYRHICSDNNLKKEGEVFSQLWYWPTKRKWQIQHAQYVMGESSTHSLDSYLSATFLRLWSYFNPPVGESHFKLVDSCLISKLICEDIETTLSQRNTVSHNRLTEAETG